MVRSFWKDAVTVIRPGTRVSPKTPGKAQPDWSNPVSSVTYTTCRIQAGSSTYEDERPLWRYQVYLPVDADVRVGDRLSFVIGGTAVVAPVENEGPPLINRGPAGLTGHVRVNVIRADS